MFWFHLDGMFFKNFSTVIPSAEHHFMIYKNFNYNIWYMQQATNGLQSHSKLSYKSATRPRTAADTTTEHQHWQRLQRRQSSRRNRDKRGTLRGGTPKTKPVCRNLGACRTTRGRGAKCGMEHAKKGRKQTSRSNDSSKRGRSTERERKRQPTRSSRWIPIIHTAPLNHSSTAFQSLKAIGTGYVSPHTPTAKTEPTNVFCFVRV